MEGVVASTTHVLETWVVGGGGAAIAVALLRFSYVVGKLAQTLRDIEDRVDRLEKQTDRREHQRPILYERRDARGDT